MGFVASDIGANPTLSTHPTTCENREWLSGSLDHVSGTSTLAPPKPSRLHSELLVFGLVGLTGFITDVGIFNLLRYAGEPGILEHKPLTAKVISVAVATLVTYLGNRHWTWRGRSREKQHQEVVLFVAFNIIGMGIAVACLGVSHYLLGFTSALADNVAANGFGLVLGTAFRFWAYRTHVFSNDRAAAP